VPRRGPDADCLPEPRVAADQLLVVKPQQVLDELDQLHATARPRRSAPHHPTGRREPYGLPGIAARCAGPRPQKFDGRSTRLAHLQSHVELPARVAVQQPSLPAAPKQHVTEQFKVVVPALSGPCRGLIDDVGVMGPRLLDGSSAAVAALPGARGCDTCPRSVPSPGNGRHDRDELVRNGRVRLRIRSETAVVVRCRRLGCGHGARREGSPRAHGNQPVANHRS
jgi:hypothetical protein